MKAPNFIKFLAKHFPGETKKISDLSMREWERILGVDFPYLAYASLRAPLLFVDPDVIDKCCPPRHCFSPKIVETLRKIFEEERRREEPYWPIEKADFVISEEARKEPEKYHEFVALACYCPNLGSCISSEIPLDYRGPAILICPERLEVRVEAMQDRGIEDPLMGLLEAVYAHEVVHSYIDAWSTSNSPSRIRLSSDRRADEFYHALLEESIATAVGLGTLRRRQEGYFEKAYVSYLLKNLPAEYLGSYYVINRIEELGLGYGVLGNLTESYSFPGSSPPLWSICIRVLLKGIGGVDVEALEWILRHRYRIWRFEEAMRFLHKYLRALFGRPYDLKDLWKIAAISWILKAPSNY